MALTLRAPSRPTDPTATELAGSVARVTQRWENEDGTYTLLAELESGQTVRGPAEHAHELERGRHYHFFGRWTEHQRYGWQFIYDCFAPDAPADPEGLTAYLAKHCDGIGDVTATKLVTIYGEAIVQTLIATPDVVAAAGHLAEDVAREAGRTLDALCDPALRQAHLDVSRLFRGHGFYGKAIGVALKKWGRRAPEIIRRDPFVLLTAHNPDIPGCGFLRVDRLYQALGLNPRRLKRQALAAWYALSQRDGDTWASLDDALDAVRRQIGGAEPRERRAVAMMVRAGWFAYRMTEGGDQHWVTIRARAIQERVVAARILDMRGRAAAWPTPLDDPDAFARLSDHQRKRLMQALTSPVAVLAGSPGTGKTYTAATVIQALVKRFRRDRVAVAAPTGKAAVRIGEKLNEAGITLETTTIHRLLGVTGQTRDGWRFAHHEDRPLPHRFVVLDECSMIDTALASAILRACGPDTNLLLVGDQHQLPPVGHGAFLRDVIAAGVPTATLTEIRRNAGAIVHTCADIKDGKLPDLAGGLDAWPEVNLVHLSLGRTPPGEDRTQRIKDKLDAVYDWLKAQGRWDLVNDVQVITARNATRQLLNRHLQERLNPDGQKGSPVFRVADKVICLKNGLLRAANSHVEHYTANGEIGRVEGFGDKTMIVRLSAPERLVTVYLRNAKWEGDEPPPGAEEDGTATGSAGSGPWDLAYACTCHKYQGSEAPVVVVLVEGAGKLGSREWIYTALSRARELCIVVGERQELARYVRNVTLPDRKTFLAEMLRGEVQL
jgi:exodeoxyribonuclease V alpha subunit